ncbi:MAG: GNAT family N-acetyltransferase, partial [Cyanobacteria bacterium P01_F01_bin.42]
AGQHQAHLGLSLRVISEEAEVSSLAREWNELCLECPESDLFQSAEYVLNWWMVFARDHDLRVYAVRDRAAKLLGLLPAFLIRRRKFTQGDYYELRFLGSHGGLQGGYFDLLARPRDRTRVTGMIVPAMLGEGAVWRTANLKGVPTDSPFARRLMRDLGVSESSFSRVKHEIIELPPSFPLYLNTLGPDTQKLVQVACEKAGFDARTKIEVHTEKQDVAAWVERYIKLGLGRPNSVLTSQDGTFVKRLCADLIRSDRVSAVSCVVDRKHASVLLTYRWGGTTYVDSIRTTRDKPNLDEHLALCGEAIRHVIKHGASRCDFLASNSVSKMLAPQSRETIDVLVSRSGGESPGFGRRLKSLLKRQRK